MIVFDKIKPFLPYVIILILFIIMLSLNTNNNDLQKFITNSIEMSMHDFYVEMDTLDKEIKEKDKKIKDLTISLSKSEQSYNKVRNELNLLKTEVNNIHEPKDLQEIKTRLNSLGYSIK